MTCADCTHCPWTHWWREVVSWGMHCLQKQRRQRVPLKPPETLLSNTWTPACETCQDSWPTELQHNTIYPVHEMNGRDKDLSWAVVPENPPFHLPTPLLTEIKLFGASQDVSPNPLPCAGILCFCKGSLHSHWQEIVHSGPNRLWILRLVQLGWDFNNLSPPWAKLKLLYFEGTVFLARRESA